MEAVVQSEKADQDAPQFLLDWGAEPRSPRPFLTSVLLHAATAAILLLLPGSATVTRTAPDILARLRHPTPLVAPPEQLTQREPNRGKIGKEFDLESLLHRPRVYVPPSRPSVRIPGSAGALPGAPLPEPPRIESAESRGPQLPLGSEVALPPPQIQPVEKPKLAFERPGSQFGAAGQPAGRIQAPNTSVSEAARSVARSGRGGGLVIGDLEEGSGLGGGVNLPGIPGRVGSSLELLSDPQGVDFKPYLIRILATVRRNWFAVIPESAKLGRQGRVLIQFAIQKDGSVPKLVIASPSGTEALDRAAVAGISASNPFPPLPIEYRGNQIRLQFTFLYNMR